jgi:hypothetical protein
MRSSWYSSRTYGEDWITVLNNVDVAIMSKVGELALRFGLNPCSFLATVQLSDSGSVLRYEAPPPADTDALKFSAMLVALGISTASSAPLQIVASDEDLYNAIQAAIDLAPKQRGR